MAAWGASVSAAVMYSNYHPGLPAEPEDPAEFDKMIADIAAAEAESAKAENH